MVGGTSEHDANSFIPVVLQVSKEEYDTCSISGNSNARIIAICDKPHQLMYFTITFRSFTPQPGGLEFKPGQDYYFITTSTGRPDGLGKRFGGRCATRNMKVAFKVCCSDSDVARNQSTASPQAGPNSTQVHFHPIPPAANATFPSRPTPVTIHSSTVRAPHVYPSTSTLRSAPPMVDLPLIVMSPVVTRAPSSSTVPPWWKQSTKVPTPKQGSHQGSDAISGESESSSGPTARRGRAWLLVVAAGIAVGVACLIVCGLGLGRRFLVVETPKETMIHTINPRLYDIGAC